MGSAASRMVAASSIAAALIAAAAAMPPRAAAQPVSGVVIEAVTGAPVAGAMVTLYEEGGERVTLRLTDAAGRFAMEARRPGPHYVVVERIGYAGVTTAAFEPGAAAEPMVIEAPLEPVRLGGLSVEAGQRCEVRPRGGRATARLWDEVRKALAAEAWTRGEGGYRYRLLRFQRLLNRDGDEIVDAAMVRADDRDAAFHSVPAGSLSDRGFVQADGDTATVYYAPDAEVLLSDSFLDTHCLGVREAENGLVGLSFDPVAGRDVPEIVGVLWVDEETAELDHFVFGYVNLISPSLVGDSGGEVHFARLPSGAWVVRAWRIRMPVLSPRLAGLVRVRRTGYREVGGFTEAVTDTLGRRVLDAEAATVFGVVLDSLGAAPPAAPVVVEVVGRGRSAHTGPDGSFVLESMPLGQHRLRVKSAMLAAWGIAAPVAEVRGELGQVAYARMREPTLADALAHSCGGGDRPEGTAAVMGRVDAAAAAAWGGTARVRVSWPAATGFSPPGPAAPGPAAPLRPDGGGPAAWTVGRDGYYAVAETVIDERGLFLLCDVPWGMRLRVSAHGTGGGAAAAVFAPPGARAVVVSLPGPPPSG